MKEAQRHTNKGEVTDRKGKGKRRGKAFRARIREYKIFFCEMRILHPSPTNGRVKRPRVSLPPFSRNSGLGTSNGVRISKEADNKHTLTAPTPVPFSASNAARSASSLLFRIVLCGCISSVKIIQDGRNNLDSSIVVDRLTMFGFRGGRRVWERRPSDVMDRDF